jgi:rhamnulokinase
MGEAIREFCRGTGQVPPETPGAVTRCILESLALAYRKAIEETAGFQGRRFEVIHVVGGGSRNTLLCQFTADATGLPVIAGPAEATVAGNVLVQALAAGVLGSGQEVRDVVRRSSALVEFRPSDKSRWDELYGRYRGFSR